MPIPRRKKIRASAPANQNSKNVKHFDIYSDQIQQKYIFYKAKELEA